MALAICPVCGRWQRLPEGDLDALYALYPGVPRCFPVPRKCLGCIRPLAERDRVRVEPITSGSLNTQSGAYYGVVKRVLRSDQGELFVVQDDDGAVDIRIRCELRPLQPGAQWSRPDEQQTDEPRPPEGEDFPPQRPSAAQPGLRPSVPSGPTSSAARKSEDLEALMEALVRPEKPADDPRHDGSLERRSAPGENGPI